jgi:hypothetical protein
MIVKIVTARRGVNKIYHPVLSQTPSAPGEEQEPLSMCALLIDPKTGRSLTCEHKVKAVWES